MALLRHYSRHGWWTECSSAPAVTTVTEGEAVVPWGVGDWPAAIHNWWLGLLSTEGMEKSDCAGGI